MTDVKEDMNFRRYLYRGKANALAESILLAMGRNINKLHCKLRKKGSYLFSIKRASFDSDRKNGESSFFIKDSIDFDS